MECIIGGGLSYKNGQIAYTDQYKYLQIRLDTLLQQYNLEYRDIKHQEPISLQIELVDILSGKTTTISVPLYAKPLMSEKQYANIIPQYDAQWHYVGEKRSYINLQSGQTVYAEWYFQQAKDTARIIDPTIQRKQIPNGLRKSFPAPRSK